MESVKTPAILNRTKLSFFIVGRISSIFRITVISAGRVIAWTSIIPVAISVFFINLKDIFNLKNYYKNDFFAHNLFEVKELRVIFAAQAKA